MGKIMFDCALPPCERVEVNAWFVFSVLVPAVLLLILGVPPTEFPELMQVVAKKVD
jgi:hypothetical protein